MRALVRALLLCAALATPARAYVRTRTSTGTPIAWRGHCPQLILDALDNPELPRERLRAALGRSAAAWNDPTSQCQNPRIEILPGESSGRSVAFDDANVVLWRLPGFCDDPRNAKDEVCLSPNAAAVTTVFYYDKPGQSEDGELLQVDIEINATHFSFGDDGAPDKIDLENTMTHELGHVLGLDHTCYTIAGSAPAVDASGQPVPRCFPLTSLPPSVTSATMFNFEAPGETDKRRPKPEEWNGICNIYQGRAAQCEPPGETGCQLVPLGRIWPLGGGVILLGLGLLVALRRAWRRR